MDDDKCTPLKTKDLPAKEPTMSNSLKERLKRCGRYHVRSPGQALERPLTNSLSKNNGNPEKDKLVLKPDVPVKSNSYLKRKLTLTDSSIERESDCKFSQPDLLREKINCPVMLVAEDQNTSSACSSNETLCVNVKGELDSVADRNDSLCNASNGEGVNCLNENSTSTSHGNKVPILANGDRGALINQSQHLDAVLKEKLELLRKLKMVKMYREKNDLTALQILINRWREVSQSALSDLLALHPEPKPSMGELLTHLQVEPHLVHYDADGQEFSN